jgi:hypothetical protein
MSDPYVVVDCCPVPRKLAPVLQEIQDETGCSYASVYRGEDPAAANYLTGAAPCYKHTQAWIFAHYPPGVANPPGRSTHERRSDGVPYPGPIGRPLRWWQCGIDVDDAHVAAFIAAAKKRGWLAFRPYSTAVEYHHVNFSKQPQYLMKLIAKWTTLQRGDKGRLVHKLTKQLVELGYMHAPTKSFGVGTQSAVKDLQRHYALTPDGVVGPHTRLQIRAAIKHLHRDGTNAPPKPHIGKHQKAPK